jgi:hypothetical protein
LHGTLSKNSAMIQTINLQNLTSRLLRQHPDLSVWLQVCEIYIDKFEGDSVPRLRSDFSTRLVIECRFPAVADLFLQNIHRFLGCLINAVPIPIHVEQNNEPIVKYRPIEHLQLKSTIRGFTMLASTIDTTKQQQIKENTIDLVQIPSPMQEMVRERVAFLGLPVYLKPDGGYQLPNTSFDIAWQEIGNTFKRGEEFNISSSAETTNGKQVNQQSAPRLTPKTKQKDTATSPRMTLMRNKLADDDIQLGRGSHISKTVANFMAKVNLKNHTREEILGAIAQRTPYGTQLIGKLQEAYSKKDKLYKIKPEEWMKVEIKIVEECARLLTSPAAETQAETQEEAIETAD